MAEAHRRMESDAYGQDDWADDDGPDPYDQDDEGYDEYEDEQAAYEEEMEARRRQMTAQRGRTQMPSLEGARGWGKGGHVANLSSRIDPLHDLRPETARIPPLPPVTPKAPARDMQARLKGRGKRKAELISEDAEGPVEQRRTEETAPNNDWPPRFMTVLTDNSDLPAPVLEQFIWDLGGNPTTMSPDDFAIFNAKSVAAVIRNLALPGTSGLREDATPLTMNKLYSTCATVADWWGGPISASFKATGLHDEALELMSPTTQPQQQTNDSENPIRELTRALAAAFPPALDKSELPIKHKFDGVLVQDGDGADEDFDMLTRPQHRMLCNRFVKRGGLLHPEEKPSLKQLSAFRARLRRDENPGDVEMSMCGPFGDRAARFISRTADISVGGEKKRRRIRGPAHYEDWEPCWRIIGNSLLILDGATQGPIEAYKRRIQRLALQFKRHFNIIAFAEAANRTEKWPEYREIIVELVASGRPPLYWDETMPWNSVVYMAAEDIRYWEEYVEKVCDRAKDPREAAELAAREHRSYLPPNVSDGFEEMTSQMSNSAPGPYSRRGTPIGATPPPPPAAWERNAHETTPKQDTKDSQGRWRTFKQVQLCYTWNRNNGCDWDACPDGRVHRCEWCRSPMHRASECPNNASGNGKGGGGKAGKSKGRKGRKGE